ncbi:MAG: hypothetical protein J0L73_07980 [Verrucomicrobia bacterium]|nr:hypothetical protein [Verrucomicrobiota bacterium]
MPNIKPLEDIWQRVEFSKHDSDSELFDALLLAGECVVKLVTLGFLAALRHERFNQRYRLLTKIAQADGIGEWAMVLDDLVKGPPSHELLDELKALEKEELTQISAPGSWQYEAVTSLKLVLDTLGLKEDISHQKIDGRRWFGLFATLRNGTRGHGATLSSTKSLACPILEQSIRLITDNFSLFRREWAFLFRNISGKYRVTPISEAVSSFDDIKSGTQHKYINGVYIYFDSPQYVELLESTPEITDFFFPNGKFGDKKFEFLSYATGDRHDGNSSAYLAPAENLLASETKGLGKFEVYGNCFANIPGDPKDYIHRPILERRLEEALMAEEQDRIVTLSGRGGIGKTSLTLTILHQVSETKRYEMICWFSSRDIDLLVDGPQFVSPDVITQDDVCRSFVRLMQPGNAKEKGFSAKQYFEKHLGRQDCSIGPILFVFDNFETVRNPASLFMWLHSFVRHPNKVLVTARHKEFTGDFEIPVEGMTETECLKLIAAVAGKFGIADLLTPEYITRLIDESGGHPYVIKVLLGEVAKARKLVDIKRIVATQERILNALFERTFAALSHAAQRIFLTLCNWNSSVPSVAIHAVLLRPANERINVTAAIEELRKSSLIEVIGNNVVDEIVTLPLAAMEFGKTKLAASPLKTAAQADSQLLQLFGAAQKSSLLGAVQLRVERLFTNVSRIVAKEPSRLSEYLPILELVAQQSSEAWLALASLYEEQGTSDGLKKAQECVRHFLESGSATESSLHWRRLADLSEQIGDLESAVHALIEMCERKNVPFFVISNAANKINNLFSLKRLELDSEEKRILIARLAKVMSLRMNEANADDYSRIAYLYLHLKNQQEAKRMTSEGMNLDGDNSHLKRLGRKLAIF